MLAGCDATLFNERYVNVHNYGAHDQKNYRQLVTDLFNFCKAIILSIILNYYIKLLSYTIIYLTIILKACFLQPHSFYECFIPLLQVNALGGISVESFPST